MIENCRKRSGRGARKKLNNRLKRIRKVRKTRRKRCVGIGVGIVGGGGKKDAEKDRGCEGGENSVLLISQFWGTCQRSDTPCPCRTPRVRFVPCLPPVIPNLRIFASGDGVLLQIPSSPKEKCERVQFPLIYRLNNTPLSEIKARFKIYFR